MGDKVYDLIIIGAGPAGLAAAAYGGRARLSTLMIEKAKDGGQIATTDEIENYPGQVKGDTGPSLVARMAEQAERFGAERIADTVTDVELEGDIKTITCVKGTYKSRTVIVATGANPRPIGCPGEKDYVGKGVSYCATCDGAFFEDLEMYVVGGGDAAVEEALFLTKFGRKVTIIHRRDELRAAKSIQEKAFANPKMEFLWDSVVTEVKGEDGMMSSFVVKNVKTNEETELFPSDDDDGIFGLFVFVGFLPQTELFKGKLNMEDGYIIGTEDMHTNIKGVFVAGDCKVKSLRQVVTATADGAIAATQAEKYIAGH